MQNLGANRVYYGQLENRELLYLGHAQIITNSASLRYKSKGCITQKQNEAYGEICFQIPTKIPP